MEILTFLIVFKVLVLAAKAEEKFFCNSLIQTNRTANSTPVTVFVGIYSEFLCADLCSKFKLSCALFWYKPSEKQCLLYVDSWALVPQQSDQICQRVSYIPSTVSTISTILPQTTTISNPLSACPPTFTNYVRNGSSNCPSFANCTCDKIVGTTSSSSASADACFDACATSPGCLAFSYFPGLCYLATQASDLTLTNSTSAFTCYCQKPTAASTSITVINGISYTNLSCYPQRLFSGSYSKQIPLGGRQEVCQCKGGLEFQTDLYHDQTATSLAECFSACNQVASPPCRNFAFIEMNKTCIISPGSTGILTDKTDILICSN